MLAKVPVESLSVRTLENLRRLAASGDGAKWLQHLPTLDRSLTTILSNHRLLEMTTGRLFKELAESGQTSAVARVALQLIEIGDFQTELGRSRRYQFRSVAEVAAAWKALKTSREGQYFRTPLASLQNPPESYRKLLHGAVLIPLETREAIAREGWEQRNCISSYTAAADAGKVYLFKLLHPERATVALKIRKDRWSVSELKGPRNRPVRRDTRLLVDRVLKAANGGTSLYAQAKWDQ
jgi:hypothetical protein